MSFTASQRFWISVGVSRFQALALLGTTLALTLSPRWEFTRDGQAVVVGGEDFPNGVDDATIRYFKVSTGAELVAYHQLGSANSFVKAVAISPDGGSLGYTLATDLTTAVVASPF